VVGSRPRQPPDTWSSDTVVVGDQDPLSRHELTLPV
jgi:hypothetical protein